MVFAKAVRAAAAVERSLEYNWLPLTGNGDGSDGPVTKERAEQLSPIAAAHRILTNSFGMIPFGVYVRKDHAREPVSDPPLDRMLHGRPNPNMSRFMLQKTQMSNAFWHGWGAIWNIRDPSGNVVERMALPSDCAAIRHNKEDNTWWYDYNVDGVQRSIPSGELSLLFFESYDGAHGRGILQMAREMAQADSMAQQYQRKFYANGARISGIVEVDGDASPETREKVRGQFVRFAKQDAFKVAVVDHGMKYTPLGLSQADCQFIESRSFTVEEAARFTGIPKYMLQTGKEAYDSNRKQRVDYVTDTLVPYITQAEQEDTYKILRLDQQAKGWYIKGNPAVLLRGDDESRAKVYQQMIYSGMELIDECRALEELPPLPNGLGKIPLCTRNLGSIERIAKGET